VDGLLRRLDTPLPQLTYLSLSSSELSSGDLRQLLALTPQLRTLDLSCMAQVDSLVMLEPVQRTLTALDMSTCTHAQLSPAALLFLRQVPQLSELRLEDSLNAPLDEFSLAVLTPPSDVLRALKSFHYEPPQEEDESEEDSDSDEDEEEW